MNKPISAIFVKVKVDMLGLIVHDSLDITSVNFKHKKMHTITAPKVNSRLLAYHGRLPCWRSYKILEKNVNKEVPSWCPSFCSFALSLYPLLSRAMRTFSYQHSHKRILPTVVLKKNNKNLNIYRLDCLAIQISLSNFAVVSGILFLLTILSHSYILLY